jgi:2-amino-4-hydroxy-6-hydroxymethyldihydropteridine diphosphokinase
MAIAYLLVGGNLDNTVGKFDQLKDMLQNQIGEVLRSSKLYQSAPWGFESSHSFINQAIAVQTVLTPEELLGKTQDIEKSFGRKKNNSGNYEDRSMDIDIIFYDNDIINKENLHIPHPKMHLRNFVLVPLQEIASTYIHPILKKTVTELFLECEDESKVEEI